MSYRISKWVDEHSPVKGAALSLLRIMADRVHDDREFWCRNTELMKALRCSERTVQRLTHDLEACGAIEKVRRTAEDGSGRQISNLYRVLTPGYVISNPRPRPGVVGGEGGRVTKLSPSQGDETVTLPLTKTSPSGVTKLSPPKGTTPKNPTKNHNGSAASARAREDAQGRLPLIGAVPAPKSPPATFEDLENLRLDIEELVEATGETFERWLERVSDGSAPQPRIQRPGGRSDAAPAKPHRIPPAVRLEGMTADRVLRCRRDARLWRQELRRHGLSDELIAAADRVQARRTA